MKTCIQSCDTVADYLARPPQQVLRGIYRLRYPFATQRDCSCSTTDSWRPPQGSKIKVCNCVFPTVSLFLHRETHTHTDWTLFTCPLWHYNRGARHSVVPVMNRLSVERWHKARRTDQSPVPSVLIAGVFGVCTYPTFSKLSDHPPHPPSPVSGNCCLHACLHAKQDFASPITELWLAHPPHNSSRAVGTINHKIKSLFGLHNEDEWPTLHACSQYSDINSSPEF